MWDCSTEFLDVEDIGDRMSEHEFPYASVAPVTQWEFYVTFCTERSLGMLQENPIGYKSHYVSHDKLRP